MQISVQQMPEVERFLSCALPLILVSPEQPEYPGVGGSCFAIRFRGLLYFVTTKHGVFQVDPEQVEIPVRFNQQMETWSVRAIGRVPIDAQGMDLAILIPGGEPIFDAAQAQPISIDQIADMRAVPAKALFAFCGYPKADGVDYAEAHIPRDSFAGLGSYLGPLDGMAGCHSLDISFGTQPPGGWDGMSGSPVARVVPMPDGSWLPALAGVVVMAGPTRLHFVDVMTVIGALESAVASDPRRAGPRS